MLADELKRYFGGAVRIKALLGAHILTKLCRSLLLQREKGGGMPCPGQTCLETLGKVLGQKPVDTLALLLHGHTHTHTHKQAPLPLFLTTA